MKAATSVLRHIQVGKRWNGGSAPGRRRAVAHVAVDRGRVGPVGLDGDDGEAVLLDQPARDRRAGAVELRRAVARLAEQHDAAVGEAVEQLPERGIVEGRAAARPPRRSSPAGVCPRDWPGTWLVAERRPSSAQPCSPISGTNATAAEVLLLECRLALCG